MPVAVLVLEDEEVSVVMAPRIPPAELTGSARATNLMRVLWDRIARLDRFDRLPRAFGPQWLLTEPRSVPSDEPRRWVEQVLFRSAV